MKSENGSCQPRRSLNASRNVAGCLFDKRGGLHDDSRYRGEIPVPNQEVDNNCSLQELKINRHANPENQRPHHLSKPLES